MTDKEIEQRLLELLSTPDFDKNGRELILEFRSDDHCERFRGMLTEMQARRASPEVIAEFEAARKCWREANRRMETARENIPSAVAAKLIAADGKSTFPSHTFNSPALALQRDNTERLEQARQRDALPDREPDDT